MFCPGTKPSKNRITITKSGVRYAFIRSMYLAIVQIIFNK